MRSFLLFLMTFSISISFSQSGLNSSGNEEQMPGALVINREDFQGKFSLLVQSDENYDYYAIDLSQFTERFAQVYFMNLAYAESRLISLDATPEKGQAWFKSYYTNKEADITCLFIELKDKTEKAGLSMNPDEKSAWLTTNDKFNNAK